MKTYPSIKSLLGALDSQENSTDPDWEYYKRIADENGDLLDLLMVLEKTNPCGQEYYLYRRVLIVAYYIRYGLIKLGKRVLMQGRYRIIGLPISLSDPGYWIAEGDSETTGSIAEILKQAADSLKGITVVLNSDIDIHGGRLSPSTFVFYNRYVAFKDYLLDLRSGYRRKINAVLDKGKDLVFNRLQAGGFTKEHYQLYLSVCERSSAVFRILPFEYFQKCESEIFEVRDKQNLVAFLQLHALKNDLYFVYVGFDKDRKDPDCQNGISHIDLYYNILLFIIRDGIEKGYSRILFGQTSAESKSKVGCVEKKKYMYLTSKNILVRAFFRVFPRMYSFKEYGVAHNVFKNRMIPMF